MRKRDCGKWCSSAGWDSEHISSSGKRNSFGAKRNGFDASACAACSRSLSSAAADSNYHGAATGTAQA
jgi:hypothetical protein